MPDKKLTEGTTPIDYEGTLKSLTESYYNALDSINRLQAKLDEAEDTIQFADKELKKANTEIERLEAEIDKQYEIAEANVRAEIASGGTSCHWCEDKVRVEAYKEFAERSEKEIFIKQDDERKQMLKILKTYRETRTYSDTEQATDNWLRGYGEAVQDILCVFDNLLKELVGDNQ